MTDRLTNKELADAIEYARRHRKDESCIAAHLESLLEQQLVRAQQGTHLRRQVERLGVSDEMEKVLLGHY